MNATTDTPSAGPTSPERETAQHTPGPWEVKTYEKPIIGRQTYIRAKEYLYDGGNATRNLVIAKLGPEEYTPGWRETEANARLIAAAPETARKLAEYEAALRTIANSDNWNGGAYDGEIAQFARETIARAEGRAE